MEFELQIEDDGLFLDSFVIENNTKSASLFDWQHRAIEEFNKCGHQLILEAATGVGKTRCALEIMKTVLINDPKIKVLIVVPKNVILETGWYKELYDIGFQLQDIGVYYGPIKEIQKFTVTNIHNIKNISLELFDMIILDEVHGYPTARGLELLKHKFKYKLGLSATLKRSDNKHMIILKQFNYNSFKYSPKDALEDGILNSFNFYNIGVIMDETTFDEYEILSNELETIYKINGSFETILKRGSEQVKGRMLKVFTERRKLVNNYKKKFWVVRKICDKHKEDKIIIFNQFNKQTNDLYWELVETGVKAKAIHSDIKKEENDKTLMEYRQNKFNVLLASKMLDEGYNLPAINVGIIMAADSSPRQTVQRLGRILRKKDRESYLYQIYCVNTFEDKQSNKKAEFYKPLANDFREYIVEEEEDLEL